ncbi:MAG: aspartate aminotransferase-like enzyme [Bradymonadia bacterium]|jgi:aspartate aminotransferase-like enzyme
MAAAQPHHRSTEFAAITHRALDGLRWLWDTDDDVLLMAGSGTAGMEAALRSALEPSDRVVVVTGGKFAERWLSIVRLIGCTIHVLDVEWGRSASAADLETLIDETGVPTALVCVASETSTGALHPVADLIRTLRDHAPEALAIVDGITAVGCADLSMRRDAIDVLVSGSQKAFGLPPGAAAIGVSARAWERIEETDAKNYYFDLRAERKQTAKGQSAFTPPIPLVVGFAEVIDRWRKFSREELFAHSETLAIGMRAAAAALGLSLFAKDVASPALTSIEIDGIDVEGMRAFMRDRLGVWVAGGQESAKGRVLRIGHLGAVDAFDIVQTVAALEIALVEYGAEPKLGVGVSAALSAMQPRLASAQNISTYNP